MLSKTGKMAVQLHVVRNMGCLGWVECYWCPYWVHNPLYSIIWDGIERPLCEWCMLWYCLHAQHDGIPYEPSARRRAARVLQKLWGVRYPVDERVCMEIASFLIKWHVP